MKIKLLAIAALGAFATACASTPPADDTTLASYPDARILIAGNCDERGTREYNLALGARRANAARSYLGSQGVDPSRISTTSYGKERPSCTQSGERCWAINRNATTSIVGSSYTN